MSRRAVDNLLRLRLGIARAANAVTALLEHFSLENTLSARAGVRRNPARPLKITAFISECF